MTTWSRPPVPPRLLASAQVPLVGRRSELAAFEDVWSTVGGGTRQVVFVGGEPGAGKTRLLAEVATVLAGHDAAVLMGTSAPDHGVPYEPFVEIIDHVVASNPPGGVRGMLDDRAAAELGRLVPQLARSQPHPTGSDDTAGVRRVLFDAVAHLLRVLTEARPVVVVLDDLQWAHPPTLAMLNHLVATTVDARLLVLAAFRTTATDRSDDLTMAIADLYRLEGVRRIDLAGLDTDDIAEYLVRQGGVATGEARRSAPLLRDLTGGNPFFLREVWRDLQQRGGLPALRSSQVRAPRSVGDTLERRLAGLGETSRRVLEMAAVLGGTFDVGTVATASEFDATQVLAAVDAAATIGMLEPTAGPTGAYTYVHALSRQAVLERLTPSRLAQLHLRAATALEPRRDEAQVVPRLAHHYLQCHVLGHGERAARYASEAAQQAARSLAFEEAAEWYERAASVPGVDRHDRATRRLAAAANRLRAGQFAHARDLYEELATSGDPETRLDAAVGYEDASWRPGRPGTRAADLLTSALDAAALSPDDPRHITALASLGRALHFAGEGQQAREVGARAIELARHHGDEALVLYALAATLWEGLTPAQAEAQFDRATEVVAGARAAGDHDLLGPASYFASRLSYILGRPREFEEAVRDNHRAMVASGYQPLFAFVRGSVEQGLRFLRGDFAAARRKSEELVEVSQAFGSDDSEGSFGLQVFMIRRETGALESVRPLVTGDEALDGRWPAGLLALYTELDLRAGMRRVLRHVMGMITEHRSTGAQWAAELVFATEAALALDDLDVLRQLRPFLEQYRGLNLVTGEFVATFGAADRHLARVVAALGDNDRAEQLFASALELDVRMGSLVHEAETLLHHGLHLVATGDGARGRELLGRARDLAEPIGQQRVLRQLPPVREEAGPDGLSEREVEVLRLLAEGLSNREIGERLYISGNTAANHVRSILMKTGAANRTQAAMYATSHDLA